MGCVMMRVCNLDSCPAGIATQKPELRARFKGKPEYVMRFMRFIARELREIMAQMGLRTLDEMVGRTDLLVRRPSDGCWKRDGVDLSALLGRSEDERRFCRHDQGVVRQLQPCLLYTSRCV